MHVGERDFAEVLVLNLSAEVLQGAGLCRVSHAAKSGVRRTLKKLRHCLKASSHHGGARNFELRW